MRGMKTRSIREFTAAFTLFVALFGLNVARAQPDVNEIITKAIAKRASDKEACVSFTNMAHKQEIKYDGDFNPKEIKTLRMKVYHIDSIETAEIISMTNEDDEQIEPKKIREKVEEMNEKWREEQEDEEKGSREDYVDPLTEEGRGDYTYELVDTRDSSFATISGAVTATDSAGGQIVIDESIDQLLTYYVIRATSTVEDQKHINATYWIDAENFGVLHQEFSPAKRPRFVDRLDFQLDYQVVTMNQSRVYLPQRFELKGKAGFLFFHGHFGVIETFTDYECDPELTTPPSDKRYFYRDDEQPES